MSSSLVDQLTDGCREESLSLHQLFNAAVERKKKQLHISGTVTWQTAVTATVDGLHRR